MGLLDANNYSNSSGPSTGAPDDFAAQYIASINAMKMKKQQEARLAQAAKYQQLMEKRNAPITGDLALYRSGQSGERSTSTNPMSAVKPASAVGMQLGRHKSIGLGRTKF